MDTNLLLYAERCGDPARGHAAKSILDAQDTNVIIPLQVLGELYRILARKMRWDSDEASTTAALWAEGYALSVATWDTYRRAMLLSGRHQLHFWDAAILVSCLDAGCTLLLSEDMQNGFSWNGITIVNPFQAPRHPLLDAFLSQRT